MLILVSMLRCLAQSFYDSPPDVLYLDRLQAQFSHGASDALRRLIFASRLAGW